MTPQERDNKQDELLRELSTQLATLTQMVKNLESQIGRQGTILDLIQAASWNLQSARDLTNRRLDDLTAAIDDKDTGLKVRVRRLEDGALWFKSRWGIIILVLNFAAAAIVTAIATNWSAFWHYVGR